MSKSFNCSWQCHNHCWWQNHCCWCRNCFWQCHNHCWCRDQESAAAKSELAASTLTCGPWNHIYIFWLLWTLIFIFWVSLVLSLEIQNSCTTSPYWVCQELFTLWWVTSALTTSITLSILTRRMAQFHKVTLDHFYFINATKGTPLNPYKNYHI